MGVAYSQDLRDRVMAAVDGGLGVYAAAPLFRVSVSYIYKALGRRRATGDVTAHKSGGGQKPKLTAYDEALRAQVARCPRGERLVAPIPWGHWKTTTLLGALRQDGLVAPCAFDGPINGEKFRAWVEQFLIPELKQGDIVILDNLPSHKVEGVTAIENPKARLLYLPSYSPDLNPIEQWFAKLKALLRKAAARTFDTLIDAIAAALQTFTPDECANYLANSGYRRQ